ncbi:phosphoribosylglycinamide formyltransferase [Piedraia hortae CBS 480.64]|uniref:phosphoribosylglycinamide formyltransferase 1 n=1 Tax=Piedraia hortae CBS 480.64 TaxID=1314780 RepID=A0A6A7C4X4_9PEZI|nr:phosphoribosylglycinamide formyltransferase [Piedraia hortae CBS 480.64]
MTHHRLIVLISGSGTNLQALIDASNTPSLPNTHIIRVISDRKAAYGLTRAQNASIPTTYHGFPPYRTTHPSDPKAAYDADLALLVLSESPDLVVCAGFMRILTPSFLDPLRERGVDIINLHPSLHGDLVGKDCIQRAWEEYLRGERTMTGVMVHFVIREVDEGECIAQEEVDIRGCRTLGQLEKRMRGVEHGVIVRGTRRVFERREGGG